MADDLIDPATPHDEVLRPLRLWLCTECWLLQLDPVERPPDLRHGHGAGFSSTILAHLEELAERFARGPTPARPLRVLDAASEAGHLLRAFQERGAVVLGVERDADAAKAARLAGIPTITGALDVDLAAEIVAQHGPFDLVIVNHALAHVADPRSFLAASCALLAPGGRIVFEFHHALGIVRDGQFDVVGHAHQTYWSLAALAAALAGQSLVLLDAEEVPIHGGSVLAVAGIEGEATLRPTGTPSGGKGGPGARGDRVAAILAEERSAGLQKSDGYGAIAAHADRVRTALLAFFDDARSRRALVAGYGAPGRGATLLNFCGLTAEDLPFTVDRSPMKHGRLLPGCRVPIRTVEALDAARPGLVLILPWPLAAEIVEQNEHVRSWGGRFVVAMPSLRVLD